MSTFRSSHTLFLLHDSQLSSTTQLGLSSSENRMPIPTSSKIGLDVLTYSHNTLCLSLSACDTLHYYCLFSCLSLRLLKSKYNILFDWPVSPIPSTVHGKIWLLKIVTNKNALFFFFFFLVILSIMILVVATIQCKSVCVLITEYINGSIM